MPPPIDRWLARPNARPPPPPRLARARPRLRLHAVRPSVLPSSSQIRALHRHATSLIINIMSTSPLSYVVAYDVHATFAPSLPLLRGSTTFAKALCWRICAFLITDTRAGSGSLISGVVVLSQARRRGGRRRPWTILEGAGGPAGACLVPLGALFLSL